jgi:serine/threonine protein kinase
MVSRLELHRNIITYYRAWQEELHFLIQMEYCHSNLSDFVSGRTLSERFLWDCFQQIAQGLSHVHKGGLIHLDIKPENILVDLKGHRVHPVYKLGDFGQARLPDHWADGSEGDSQYVAPEVISKGKGGADPTAAADIFSLGLLMFELSSRYELPKNGDLWHDLRSGSASIELPIAMAKIQCLELKALIMRCLEPNPTSRITADAIVDLASTHLQKREGGSC